jgi:hypothetical protein
LSYRNAKILKLAQESPCQWCGANDGTIVAAHSNQQRDGKGLGIKADDYRVAYMCYQCHTYIDSDAKATRDEKRDVWEGAHRNTIGWLFDNGHIKIV